MTEDKPQGRAGSPDPDDDAVPHPFGTGRPAEEPAAPEDDAVVAEPEQPAEPAEPEPEAEPESPAPVEETDEVDEVTPAPAEADSQKVRVTGRRRRDPLAAALIGILTLLLGFAFA